MNVKNDGHEVTLTLDEGEKLQSHVIQSVIARGLVDQNCWSISLVLLPEVANAERDMLQTLGFVYTRGI